jgi:1,2-phenylacetyl-CoA epoxidase catalytic subunit
MTQTLAQEIVDQYGQDMLDLVLLVYVNFYTSELEIIDLCAKWIPRRELLAEKSYLLKHASDEVIHAELFKSGVEHLGIPWHEVDQEKFRIQDIDWRFKKLFDSDDELQVLIGLNLYAEGVLALEEIEQLGQSKPRYFKDFARICRDEKTHVAFGLKVAKRLLAQSAENRSRAQEYCSWYADHMKNYLGGELSKPLQTAIKHGFISADYVERTYSRFRSVMSELDLQPSI